MDEDKLNKTEISAANGAQIIIANDNATVNITQNNSEKNFSNAYKTHEKFKNDKKEDYLKIWNGRLFLHQDNNEKPLTLKDAFIMPDYIFYKNNCKIDFWAEGKLDKIIDKFFKYKRNTNLLIIGSPGMGKTSIVSWIANKYEYDDGVIILRFRDWEFEELKKGMLKAILQKLKCVKADLENKTIVIDGFDEMKSVNDRNILLDRFLSDILDYKNFKVIITSRPDYIDIGEFKNAIILFPFDTKKICDFYNVITGNELDSYKIEDTSVIGIPVILYMAIMSNIDITENATRPELYNRIFAEEGGIFDKFSYDGCGYDSGTQPLRIKSNVKTYLCFLRDIAFNMFKINEQQLNRENHHIPKLSFQDGYIDILEFPIKHLFESIELKIEFIHKSIYEYFVSEYISDLFDKYKRESNEKFAGILGELLKKHRLSAEILEFLKYKIKSRSNLNYLHKKLYETFQIMVQNGMMYYTGKCYKKVVECEMCVFTNILDILHLWDNVDFELDESLCNYIKLNRNSGLNLSFFSVKSNNGKTFNLRGAYLAKSNLSNCNLQGVDLSGSDLRCAELTSTNLNDANLRGANLSEINFKKIHLMRVELDGAKLEKTEFSDVDMRETNLKNVDIKNVSLIRTVVDEQQISYLRKNKCNLIDIHISINNGEEIINYEKYCIQKAKGYISDFIGRKT